jgi:hypothetical protein
MKHSFIVILLFISVIAALAAAFVGTGADRVKNWNFWVAIALAALFGSFLVEAW